MAVKLPRSFAPTHPTGGLDGYPAIDVFGSPSGGDEVVADFVGRVRRQSGKDPRRGGSPGGAYGWSIYIESPNGDDRYLTHFGSLRVGVGDQVRPGTVLGTVCDSAVSGKPRTSHIHYGLKKAAKPVQPPPARLFHVYDKTGKQRASRKTPEQIAKSLESLEKRFGELVIRRA